MKGKDKSLATAQVLERSLASASSQRTAVVGSASWLASRRRASAICASETGTDAGSAEILSQISSTSAKRSETLSRRIASMSSFTMP